MFILRNQWYIYINIFFLDVEMMDKLYGWTIGSTYAVAVHSFPVTPNVYKMKDNYEDHRVQWTDLFFFFFFCFCEKDFFVEIVRHFPFFLLKKTGAILLMITQIVSERYTKRTIDAWISHCLLFKVCLLAFSLPVVGTFSTGEDAQHHLVNQNRIFANAPVRYGT